MNKFNKKIAITTGDINGIGAEITIKALNQLNFPKENVVLISNSNVLSFYGNLNVDYEIIEIDFEKKDISPGKITAQSGDFSFRCLKKACEMAKSSEIEAIITAPVSKETLHLAGHKFNGQTEVLQSFLAHDNQLAEMLFVANDFRVLLLTRHIALKDISLNKDEVVDKIINLDKFFKSKFNIQNPKFALCALNPHAGESGILGHEEIEILSPAVDILRVKGIDITNPLPADTLFIEGAKAYLYEKPLTPTLSLALLRRQGQTSIDSPTVFRKMQECYKMPYDCYIACYHDQGLIPIKTVASEKTINMTIGLDVIRTSPCHGTAFDIAGKNLADENSMIEAILQAMAI